MNDIPGMIYRYIPGVILKIQNPLPGLCYDLVASGGTIPMDQVYLFYYVFQSILLQASHKIHIKDFRINLY
jgi:hypothetical protein